MLQLNSAIDETTFNVVHGIVIVQELLWLRYAWYLQTCKEMITEGLPKVNGWSDLFKAL